jgi:predicted nuclease of predicted toxin-antitoxin system
VKLLFDENLSPKLVRLLEREFPGSTHVEDLELRGSTDERIWAYARENGFTIVSKDTDFQERSVLYGAPPKVIWLAIGNAGTSAVADLLSRSQNDLLNFDTDTDASVLVLSLELEGGRTSR